VYRTLMAWRYLILLYGATFLVLLPVICRHFRHTNLEFLYTRNETAACQRLINENEARVNDSLLKMQKYKQKKTFCDMFPYSCSNTVKLHEIGADRKRNTSSETQFVFNNRQFGAGLAITVITSYRNSSKLNYNGQYLLQTVAKLLDIMNNTLMSEVPIYFSVCNIDLYPDEHQDIKLLPKWIPVYTRYSETNSSTKHLTYNELLNKEKEDYVYCLNQVSNQTASYFLVLEDDAFPHDNVFTVLSQLMVSKRHLTSNGVYIPSLQDVTYVKLYHPERLIGYIAFDYERIPEFISLSVIFTAVCLLICSFVITSSRITARAVYVTFLYTALVVLALDRHTLIEVRRISDHLFYMTPAPSCCSPAILFPRKGAQLMIRELTPLKCKKGFAKDTAMETIVKRLRLDARLVQPNLFTHIGHFSSLRNDLLNPFIV